METYWLGNALQRLQATQVDDVGLLTAATFADTLLNRCNLLAFGNAGRLVEIEVYLHSHSHPDPFVHCHPIQLKFGRWYLHRVGSGYRGGSFKGLDFTFGNGSDLFGGILVRSINFGGNVVCGPSKCVDFLMNLGQAKSVREFDGLIVENAVWEASSEMYLVKGASREKTVFRSSRVGLSLPPEGASNRELFLTRPYRFLTDARMVKKGRPNLILSMLRTGYSADEIAFLTGSPEKTINDYTRMAKEGATKSLDQLRLEPASAKRTCWIEGMLNRRV